MMTTSMPEFDDKPPFALIPGLALSAETDCIERVRASLATRPDPAVWTMTRICARHGWAPHPECRAALAIARDIDAGTLARPLPYHNRLHFCDVMLAAHYIGLLLAGMETATAGNAAPCPPPSPPTPLPQAGEGCMNSRDAMLTPGVTDEALRLLVLAALAHDIGHDGSTNGAHPFRLEQQSMALARPYFERAGVGDAAQASVAAMVMATDLGLGLPRARAWFAHVCGNGPAPAGDEPVPAFALFRQQPALVPMAIALSEADALASAGLSEATADAQEQRIAAETGQDASANSKLAYLDRLFPDGFLVATRFNPNLEHLRSRARLALEAGHGGGG